MPIATAEPVSPTDSTPAFFKEPQATLAEASLLPPKLQIRLAAWYRQSEQWAKARGLLDSIAEGGVTATLLDEHMALALATGEANEVRRISNDRLERHPSPSAQANLARALIELGNMDDAAGLVETLLQEAPELQTVQGLAAELALQMGDPEMAHDHCQAELAVDPARVSPRLMEARIALLSGDPATARQALTVALGAANLTSHQIGVAAGLADLLGQPGQARTLRLRAARQDASRATALADEIDRALGRTAHPSLPVEPFTPDPTALAKPTSNGNTVPVEHVSAQVAASGSEKSSTNDEPAIATVIPEEPLVDPRVLETLRAVWGYETLRPGQAAVINRVMAGQDTLAVMPTGAGKSLTFQLPAMLLSGPTLVLSPLIALMKDQAESLPPAVQARTVTINSSQSAEAQREMIGRIASGDVALVYAAPERLRQPAFIRALQSAGVARIVVDEAHCISLWGHDFRPDYLSIPAVLPELGDPPILAATATATSEIRASIKSRFNRDMDEVLTSVFRPNLRYEVETVADRQGKIDRIVALCQEEQGSGIVYVSSRRDAETIADLLRRAKVQAIHYHAGMERELRARHQDDFMTGSARVVVATVAFGMGVDKADVRFIIHAAPPGSLEAYAQESGRAGRDGLPARCIMLSTARDRTTLRRLAARDALDLDSLRHVYAGVRARADGSWAILDPASLVSGGLAETGDDDPDPRIALNLLEQGSLVKRHPDAPTGWTLRPSPSSPGTDGPQWAALANWLDLDDGRPRSVSTVQACAALGISPLELSRILAEAPGWSANEDRRLPCWELLPAGSDAPHRMNAVMLDAKRRAERRIGGVIAYQSGSRCRHVALARHLGERLEPCVTACDVCDPVSSNATTQSGKAAPQRAKLEPADLLAVVKGVHSLSYPVGKKRLVHLLSGSRESRFDPSSSPEFGALRDLKRARIEEAIDRLLTAEILVIDPDDEYKVIRVSAPRLPEPEELAAVLPTAPVFDGTSSPLLERLIAWRRNRSLQDEVPAYTIAHNTMLQEMAAIRPQDERGLAEIKGFGALRAAKYATDLLPLLHHEG